MRGALGTPQPEVNVRRFRITPMLLVCAVALLLLGCGESASTDTSPSPPSDPFVGTWQSTESATQLLVVRARDDGYTATLYEDGTETLESQLNRAGEELSGPESSGNTWRLVADGSSVLVLRDSTRGALRLTRLSASTTNPGAE